MERPSAYRFGEFELEVRAYRLTRGGQPVKLEPKAFDVLVCLLGRSGEVMSKHDLVVEAWGGIAITENAVARVVSQLRRALGDNPDQPRFIETIPTRGYRFIGRVAAVHDVPAPPSSAAPAAASDAAPSARSLAAFGMAIAAVALLAWAVGVSVRNPGGEQAADGNGVWNVRSLAVLPLQNLSGDASQDYVAEGLTQGLRDRFSELGLFGVIASTSSGRYKDSQLPATQIAKALGVDALIEGTVVRSGNRVRVSVSLVDGGSGQRVWSGRYERPFSDVMALYDEIAATAAGEAKLAADAVEATRRARKSVNPEAYDEYLRAMAFLGNRWMGGGCREAEPLLQRATERDDGFAPAHAALAWCYAYPARLGRDISDVGPKARKEVAAALALDDRLALAHAVDGTIKWRVDYDAAAGQAALRRASELDPSSGLVMMPYAETFIFGGQPERGLPMLERAIRLDPFSPDRNVQAGFSLLMAGRLGPAADRFRRAIELDPNYLTARYWLAEALAYAGEQDQAVAEYLLWTDGAVQPARAPVVRRDLEQAYARGGWPAFWRQELELAREERAHPRSVWDARDFHNRFTDPWFMARRHARLGEWEEALDALDLAWAGRSHLMAAIPVDPLFAPLRSAPRFQELLRKTGASDVQLQLPQH